MNIHTIKGFPIFLEKLLESFEKNKNTNEIYQQIEIPLFFGQFDTNIKGDINNGIRFFDKEKSPYYSLYENGEVVKNGEVTLKEFQKIFMSYLEEQYSKQ
ncbi:hypothetical protein [Aquimarina sp. AU58]|uniref:hypothetical protein n=1 Tax=Aquimarina sp. AU58 TaxID=1874112 RepID=UPI000D6E4285|nr:hypothetical protein [Aquimarina sp. AU58]